MSDRVWRRYDHAALEQEYSPSSRAPEFRSILAGYTERSRVARNELEHVELRYGSESCETIDVFPARRRDAPMFVYVHGGYWQELSRFDSAFAATDFVAAGAAFAVVGYGLAPHYSLPEIVDQVRRALRVLVSRADEHGIDRGRIHIGGSSAGAHLALMALHDNVMPHGSHVADIVAGAVLLSGVYDLEPLVGTYINVALALDPATAEHLSPIRHLRSRLPPLIVARGGVETVEFARQHGDLVAAVASRGIVVDSVIAERRNHFDLPFDLGNVATALGNRVFRQMGLRDPAE
ncbi:alpha/beta hydrolase [Nocardia sp. NPDC005998]|uniref:alpha/beta hydrolase n=1 Tax=Nocardia sp. NPDC005998 TaxID=3156894 RepID=UPI0033BC775E